MLILIFSILVFIVLFLIILPILKIMYEMKINRKILTITLFAIILLMGLVGGMIDKSTVSVSENRKLTQWEKLSGIDPITWPSKIVVYVNDHFGLRELYLKCINRIMLRCFNKPMTDSVIFGKEQWYFSQRAIENVYNSEQVASHKYSIEEISDKLLELDSVLSKKDIQLILMIIPSKPSIYRDKLPRWINTDESNRVLNIKELKKKIENDIEIFDLYDVFNDINMESDHQLYYRTDTHWNSNGGFYSMIELSNFFNNNYDKKLSFNANIFSLQHYEYSNGVLAKNMGLSITEEGLSYQYVEKRDNEIMTLSDEIRNRYNFKEDIADWKKLKVRVCNIGDNEVTPIIIGDSYLLSSDGEIFLDLFHKSYSMHYEDMSKGLPLLIENCDDANYLILSFIEYKYDDGRYNSFINNFMKWEDVEFDNIELKWK